MQRVVEKTLYFRCIAHFIRHITKKTLRKYSGIYNILFVLQQLEFTHSLALVKFSRYILSNGATPQPDERAVVARKLDLFVNSPRDQEV